MHIGFLGNGVFGSAIGSLVESNGHIVEYVDMGEVFENKPTVLFLAVPVQYLREALQTHLAALREVSVVVNLSKGIEKGSGVLPQQIVKEVLGPKPYVAVAGPSFAHEIVQKLPTTVSAAGTSADAVHTVQSLLQRPYFVIEELGTVLELELAAAMKNIYAIASGYVAGSGGGKNTHAHVQVVALREYTTLIHALEGEAQVVRPGVVGDLILTCGSAGSRNYQFGEALAKGQQGDAQTTEGVVTAQAVLQLASTAGVTLPLAESVDRLITSGQQAHTDLYAAIGFTAL